MLLIQTWRWYSVLRLVFHWTLIHGKFMYASIYIVWFSSIQIAFNSRWIESALKLNWQINNTNQLYSEISISKFMICLAISMVKLLIKSMVLFGFSLCRHNVQCIQFAYTWYVCLLYTPNIYAKPLCTMYTMDGWL